MKKQFAILLKWGALLGVALSFIQLARKFSDSFDFYSFGPIIDLLNEVVEKEKKIESSLIQTNRKVEGLLFDAQFYIQKIGLVRFNPFNDTGGDQSFILALIDEKNSGVVISGLHTRNGTRWYAKKVEDGRGVEHELSNDELKAIKTATRRS